jgi:hypothetical protein
MLDELVSVLGRDKTLSLHNNVQPASATTHFPSQGTPESSFFGDEPAGDQSFTVISN